MTDKGKQLKKIRTRNTIYRMEHLYGKKHARSLAMTGAAAVGATLAATGKLIMGILALSFFACANAFYSFGMIGAKIIAMYGMQRAGNPKEQYRYYRMSGGILVLSSLIYILYSIRLFEHPIRNTYHEFLAIGIAAVTFSEIVINMRGVLKTRQKETLLVHAIKRINLSGALISLVLTQTALLSFTEKDTDLNRISRANGTIGILMGSISFVLGIMMMTIRAKAFETDSIKTEASDTEVSK